MQKQVPTFKETSIISEKTGYFWRAPTTFQLQFFTEILHTFLT